MLFPGIDYIFFSSITIFVESSIDLFISKLDLFSIKGSGDVDMGLMEGEGEDISREDRAQRTAIKNSKCRKKS